MKMIVIILLSAALLISCKKELDPKACEFGKHLSNCGHCSCGFFCSGCFLNSRVDIIRPTILNDIDHEPMGWGILTKDGIWIPGINPFTTKPDK